MALSTLNRHLKRQRQWNHPVNDGGGGCPLVEVELSASVVPTTAGEAGALMVLLQNGRRVSVGCGFDSETLRRLVTALERL